MRGCPTNSPCRTPGTRARRGPLLMGISTKGKSPVGSPRCSPQDGSLLSPGGTTTGRLLIDQPYKNHLEFYRQLNRQLRRLRAAQDAVYISRSATVVIYIV